MKVLVAGASGQLGRALGPLLGERMAWAGSRDELDVRDAAAAARRLREVGPEVVINAAAYNNVDGAEAEAAEAFAVNALGPLHLARACREVGALLVHVSSDYVFDGSRRRPWSEEDYPRPLSVYGASKLAGEVMVASAGAAHILVRTSGVFAAGGSRDKGGSFVERILARARAGQPLRVVADQIFAPTHAPDLAASIVALLEAGVRGLFHVTNEGACSWHELAVAALRQAGLDTAVEPITSRELGAPARRPAYSVLDNSRYRSLGLPALRPWPEALAEFLRT